MGSPAFLLSFYFEAGDDLSAFPNIFWKRADRKGLRLRREVVFFFPPPFFSFSFVISRWCPAGAG